MKPILIIPGELMDLNTYIDVERGNKFGAAKIKKAETEMVHWYCIQQKPKPILTPFDLEIHWYAKDKRKDSDNISFAQKFILDGLVAAKVIPNDRFTTIKSIIHRFLVDSSYPRIEVGRSVLFDSEDSK